MPYDELYRPQYHFTARENWLNDPNGLVYYEGEYHLFFQHNPEGVDWGNMTWGHAVSTDLLHWQQLPNALTPDELGTIFSGSAVIDWANTGGFQDGPEPALVAFYTSAGKPMAQSLAYSSDRGRTMRKHRGNPVVANLEGDNRDPKVFWHAPTERWVMALYLADERYILLGSPNLRDWEELSRLEVPGASECPDLFPLPLDGKAGQEQWVFWGASGVYLVGGFDGRTFTPHGEPQRSEYGRNGYAGQTYSDAPDGRRLQILWMAGGQYPEMPFNQQMSIPCELSLRSAAEGPRLYRYPVPELASLRVETEQEGKLALRTGQNPLAGLDVELLDLELELDPGTAQEVNLILRGVQVQYDVAAGMLRCLKREAPVTPVNGTLKLRALLDRASLELFCHDGHTVMDFCVLPEEGDKRASLTAAGGEAQVISLAAHRLQSVWEG